MPCYFSRYPLVLKRGRMRMAPPPLEVQQAEETLQAQGLSTKNFKLIPSKAAIKDAAETKTDLADGDIPLFVADRLAFAGDAGPQVGPPFPFNLHSVILNSNRRSFIKQKIIHQTEVTSSF
jgi:hypothetical protein